MEGVTEWIGGGGGCERGETIGCWYCYSCIVVDAWLHWIQRQHSYVWFLFFIRNKIPSNHHLQVRLVTTIHLTWKHMPYHVHNTIVRTHYIMHQWWNVHSSTHAKRGPTKRKTKREKRKRETPKWWNHLAHHYVQSHTPHVRESTIIAARTTGWECGHRILNS